MKALKKYVLHANWVLTLISGLAFPILWLLFKTGNGILKMTDNLTGKILPAFENNNSRNYRIHKLLATHSMPDRLTDKMVKNIVRYKLPIKASLAAAVFLRNTYSSDQLLPEWKVNGKPEGLRFAKALGLKIPEQLMQNVPLEKIVPSNGIVIKPIDSCAGRGVFLVKSPVEIIELNTGKTLQSWEAMKERAYGQLNSNILKEDLWIVEHFIQNESGQAASDVKFYVFYGKLGWVSEIQRYPQSLHHTFDRSGKLIDYGIYNKNTIFPGEGASEEEIAMVEQTSLEIPVPFIRIDFLRGKDGLYFCEFTPRSGILGTINKDIDLEYGRYFHEAQARLQIDLIQGKKFTLFNENT